MNTTRRIREIQHHMFQNNLSACVVTSPENLQYLSGFQAITYSRPIQFLILPDMNHLIIPGLEERHADITSTGVENLCVYYEHPEKAGVALSPVDYLRRYLKKGMRVGVEFKNASLGFAGALTAMGIELVDISGKLTEMRAVKDADELSYIREAGRLCQYAFHKAMENAHPGITEMEFEQRGTEALFQLLDFDYPYAFSSPACITPSGPERTVMPHVYSSTRKFAEGDMVIHVRKPAINGYYAELERTFFIGKPNEAAKRAFCAMVEAQQTVLDLVKPGVTASQLDKAGRDVLRKYGYGENAIHRIGHGQGLGRHEEPYLIFNSDLPLQENMVFTIEPGIYMDGVGGFRHSDTIIVTADGYENVTEFSRTLDEMTFQ